MVNTSSWGTAPIALLASLMWPLAGACDPSSTDANEVDALVQRQCGSCHLPPSPDTFPKAHWPTVLRWMDGILDDLGQSPIDPAAMQQLTDYYQARAPEKITPLPPDPMAGSRFVLDADFIGRTQMVTNVRAVDLDTDGHLDLLVCESGGLARPTGRVTWLRRVGKTFREIVLVETPNPAHAEAFDFDADGDLDVVVAVLGQFGPSERPVGGVVLLEGDGHGAFAARTLLRDVGRVADVRPGDFNGDGRMDFAVAQFGHRQVGSVGWIEQTAGGAFVHHELFSKAGAIHTPVADLNGDGFLDIVALVSQDTETVFAYLNDGAGNFRSQVLFQAGPEFGGSGIELIDLDRDGDLDILLSNGDTADTGAKTRTKFRPHHGVRWLENTGVPQAGSAGAAPRFESHKLIGFYGTHGATAADIDGDGDIDIAAASFFNDLDDPTRQSLGWWENDGQQNFTGHGMARMPVNLATIALGDLDGDGQLDLVAGGLLLPGYARIRDQFTFKPTLSLWLARER